MPGMNQSIAADSERTRDYNKRQRAAEAAFRSMPRGAKTECAFAIRVAPSSISTVVSGKRVSLTTLILIEAWLSKNKVPA